jgi:flagellar biosynthesis/type III secretory pathway chaperone
MAGNDGLDRIDERLDRLTERHEALTHSVELLAGMQQKNEALMAQVLEAINSLARIAQAQERTPGRS